MENVLFAIPDLCTGCNRCAYVCSAVKDGNFIPSKSRIHINNFNLKGYAVPSICFQCPKPECLEACPEEAIYKNETDVVLVDLNKCNECGDCVTACPYGMIEQDAEGLAYKCDYCNGDPACIKECEPGAIVYQAEDKEQRKLRGLQMKQRIESGNPEEKRHQLGLNILDRARS
jgi:Fe-S-cluster-containing hydrogenase component 2